MKTYIAPIGYNTTSITRPVLSHGIDKNDNLFLLRPDTGNDERAQQAIEDVERMVEQIEPSITVKTISIPHDDFETAVMQCGSLIREATGEVVAVFGGGARDIFLPLTVAVLAHRNAIDNCLQFSDIDGRIRNHHMPNLTATVPSNTEETFHAIENLSESVGLPELTDNVAVSKSSVTRHVKLLEDEGLVTSETHGKTKVISLTNTGRLLLSQNEPQP